MLEAHISQRSFLFDSSRAFVRVNLPPIPVMRCHHPWPSSKIAHGRPIARRKRLAWEQKMLSRFQIAKPPMNIARPGIGQFRKQAVRSHVYLPTATMVQTFFSSFFESTLPRDSSAGRSCASITHILRKTTVAVRPAYMTWWKTGSLVMWYHNYTPLAT